ncbi:hypothetical protein FACS189490_06770 [Clostridia bacterium]|nr:hypothetical protein FACS189490_06770 [Clostridia bacterium]
MEKTIYIGTYADAVYSCKFNTETGELTELNHAAVAAAPSYITAANGFLYAAGESNNKIYSFKIEGDYALTPINSARIPDMEGFCHLSASKDGRFVAAAGYMSGTVSVVSAETIETVSFDRHKEAGKVQHAHCAVFDRTGGYVLSADLGLDKIFVYKFDQKRGKIARLCEVETNLGDGPRQIIFSRTNKAYVVNELGNGVIAYDFDWENGTLTKIFQTDIEVGKGVSGADIRLSEKEDLLYASFRQYKEGTGGDIIAVFDAKNGKHLYSFPCGGAIPRFFTVCGKFLLCANQEASNIAVFALNGEKEPELIQTFDAPKPTCIAGA